MKPGFSYSAYSSEERQERNPEIEMTLNNCAAVRSVRFLGSRSVQVNAPVSVLTFRKSKKKIAEISADFKRICFPTVQCKSNQNLAESMPEYARFKRSPDVVMNRKLQMYNQCKASYFNHVICLIYLLFIIYFL